MHDALLDWTPIWHLQRSVADSYFPQLLGLGARLKLPPGWRYESMVPASELVLGAHGEAIIVQDDLDDTYQKID